MASLTDETSIDTIDPIEPQTPVSKILDMADNLPKEDRLKLLEILVNHGAKIHPSADGCRVRFDDLHTHVQKKVLRYIQNRNTYHALLHSI